MGFVTNPSRTSFGSGEVSPSIRAANDLARHASGSEKVENFIVQIEAILTRRPGGRFVLPAKNEAQRGKMLPFRYSGSDYYTLCFNGGKMRLQKDGGFLETSPGVPFEAAVLHTEADMPNLRAAASGNVVMVVDGARAPQKMTRIGHTNWTVEDYLPVNGPVDTQNLDATKTITASAITGTGITLTAAGAVFDPGHVKGVFRLDEASQSIVPLWQASETIALTTESVPGATGEIGDVTSAPNAFDGNDATVASKVAATDAYVGRTVSPGSAILSARVKMASPAPGAGGTVTLQLYRKGSVPGSGTDGVLLAQTAYDVDLNGADDHKLTSSDTSTTSTNLWVRAIYSGAATTISFSEVVLTRLASASPPVLRRWQENVYQALTGGNTGINAPVHTSGDVAAGTGNVTWRYLHSGYGFVRITAVAGPSSASADVISRLPDSVAVTPTYRWSPPAWCDLAGWPKQIAVHDQRILFQRGNVYWLTKPTTNDNFEVNTLEDSAIARRLLAPDGSYVELQWALSSGVLVQGARDQEWLTRAPGNFDALTSLAIRDVPDTAEGSAPHIPALVDRGAVFIGRSRKRLHYAKFDRLAEQLTVDEISVASRHILNAGAVAIAWQRDPHRLLWIVLADGTLACCTLMPDEKIIGWHRHPMGNCFVEDIAAIPTADNGCSEIILQTRRTINSQVRRYYEQLMPFFEPIDAVAPTAEGAWFVDCGLRYQGAPTMRITGLDHLIGETVAILADGAEQPRKIVDADGGIDLSAAASDVIVGVPIVARWRDLPRDIQVPGGSSKGSPKRAGFMAIDVLLSAGGKAMFNDSEPEPITETGGADYGAAIPLFTGQMRLSLASATEDEGVTEIVCDNALPFTLQGVTPTLEIDEAS